jgi:hypothetical protein
LYGSTEAGGGSFVICGPAIVRDINHRKAFAIGGIHEFGGAGTSFRQIDTELKSSPILMASLEDDAYGNEIVRKQSEHDFFRPGTSTLISKIHPYPITWMVTREQTL